MNRPTLTSIDLFAGCGGLSLGLRTAGWDVVCAVEHSPMAAETYFANFIAGQGDIDGRYTEHLAKGVLAQIRSGLLVDDVRTFRGCINKVQELMGGESLPFWRADLPVRVSR